MSSTIAADRVRGMGESARRIFTIGSPELDFHAGPSGVSLDQVRAYYEIPFEEYGICTFHPVTSEQKDMMLKCGSVNGGIYIAPTPLSTGASPLKHSNSQLELKHLLYFGRMFL